MDSNAHLKRQKKRGPLTKSRNRSHYFTDVYVSDTPVTLTESEALKLQGHGTAVIFFREVNKQQFADAVVLIFILLTFNLDPFLLLAVSKNCVCERGVRFSLVRQLRVLQPLD